ncbi:aldehyde dehydrogenase family protein [Mycobacterium xenopi 3993]|nr:aldehyde dehydrogenase family protein [Mycobacterium xenopi 3993]
MALLADGVSALLIDGKLGAGSAGTFPTLNPATEEVLGAAADANAEDMSRAIDAARRAFDDTDWSRDTELRVRCLRQLRDAMRAHVEELREITIAEVGAPRMLTASAQLEGPIDDLAFSADTAESYQWNQDLGEAAPLGIPTRRTIAREAVGWSARSLRGTFRTRSTWPSWAGAGGGQHGRVETRAGHAVVRRRARRNHCRAHRLSAGVVNIVTSSDHSLGALLAKDPRVDMISFTGSTATGRSVMTDAAANIKKVFLELGGKSAFVVLDDADLAGACSVSAFAASMHAGQGCAITTRLVVPRPGTTRRWVLRPPPWGRSNPATPTILPPCAGR